ncbi:MAG: hypothetical protein CAF42_004900 [Nitrospira sp. CG24B]|nr:MAG: hypothetical protein CAF42_004900 [Nitrospira sp. CG24B]
MMVDETNKQAVVVTDIRMPFFSMVIFMVKWAIAAIPALFILIVFGVLTWGMLGGLLLSLTVGKHTDSVRTLGTETPTSVPTSIESTPPVLVESTYFSKLIVEGITLEPSPHDGKPKPHPAP